MGDRDGMQRWVTEIGDRDGDRDVSLRRGIDTGDRDGR